MSEFVPSAWVNTTDPVTDEPLGQLLASGVVMLPLIILMFVFAGSKV
jgi:hypothetical protein